MNPISIYARLAALLALVVGLAAGGWWCYSQGKKTVMADWTAEKLVASENARLRERAAQVSNERIDRDYQKQKAADRAAIAAADDGLRDLKTAIGPSNPASATSGTDDPRDTIIDQCASALVALDGYAKGVASKAVGLQSYTREVCLK